MAPRKSADVTMPRAGGIELYLKRIFSLMFGAVALTAVAAYMTIWGGGLSYLVGYSGFTGLYYIILFGALGLSLWAQVRAFHLRPGTAAVLLAVYSVLIGVSMTPLIAGALAVNPASILQAFVIAAIMFGCMAMFGYKTVKDLSFLGIFLMMGMIGLILVGLASFIWPLGGTFATIVCFIGVLVFALFTAYDMQTLKRAYSVTGDENTRNQLAVLGALHLYISFVAMFQYLLSLLNRN
ncbi:MAG: Bax inhibitor-1/YccA family protein [Alphaproteobacteria bacterium]|nr:Bax inhibitor-1/YccA family protein [Alphaproteobacteria bacterium]